MNERMIIVKKSLIVILASFITLSGCNQQYSGDSEVLQKQANINNSEVLQKQETSNQLDVDLVESFDDLNGLAGSSPVVITAKIDKESEKFTYGELTFLKTKIKIKDVYRDEDIELEKNDEIILLQNDIGELDPKVMQNEEVLLFIKKYEGPVIQNAYRIVGLVQGHFKLKDGQIIFKADEKSKMYSKTNGISVEEVKEVLQVAPYVSKKYQVKTKEEIQNENENENKLEEQLQSEENK